MSSIIGFAVDGEELWYMDACSWRLVHLDVAKGCYVESFYFEECIGRAFSNGVCYKNKIVFAPRGMRNNSILIVDKLTKKIELIPIRENEYDAEKVYFDEVVQVNNRMFLIPSSYHAVIEMNLDNHEIRYHYECMNNILPLKLEDELALVYMFGAVWRERILVLPSYMNNRIIWYDVDSGESGYIEIPVKGVRLLNVCVCGDEIYVLSRNTGEIFICDLLTMTYKEKIVLAEGENLSYLNLIDCGKYLLVVQFMAQKSCKIDKKNHEVSLIDFFGDIEDIEEEWRIIVRAKRVTEDEVWMLMSRPNENKVGIFDIRQNTIVWKDIPEMRLIGKSLSDLIFEDGRFDLNEYIKCLKI